MCVSRTISFAARSSAHASAPASVTQLTLRARPLPPPPLALRAPNGNISIEERALEPVEVVLNVIAEGAAAEHAHDEREADHAREREGDPLLLGVVGGGVRVEARDSCARTSKRTMKSTRETSPQPASASGSTLLLAPHDPVKAADGPWTVRQLAVPIKIQTVATAAVKKQTRPTRNTTMMRERWMRTIARAGRTPTLSAKSCERTAR